MKTTTNHHLIAVTLMTTLGAAACVGGQESDLGLASQSIVPGIGTTCASGALEGDTTPDRDPIAPWVQVEGVAVPNLASRSGSFVASLAGAAGVAYTRVEPRAARATQLGMDVNVAIRPDPVTPALGCPTVPVANVGMVVSDGARMAGLAVGRMRNSAGVEISYVAIRALDRCAAPLVVAPFDFDITEFHVYSLRLDRVGATVYVDKEPEPVLSVAYDRLDAATPLLGAQYGLRTEHATATWDYVRYSGCGIASAPPAAPVSSCGGACPGNRAPSCALAAASQPSLWPPNHSFRPERVIGITDADGDEVAYSIDYVTSDEPGDAQGGNDNGDDVGVDDQDTNDDGSLHATGDRRSHGHGALLRAERSGAGNGRVYSMHVTASDGRGGSCQTTVRVCVPHDRSGDPCVDDGQNYVITAPPPAPPAPVAPGTLRCPAPSRALAGSPVTLAATGVPSDARVRWSVSTAPSSTRAYRFASTYVDSQTAAMVATGPTTPFTSVIVGDFTVHAEATYANGTIDQCDTTVSMLGHGLRVELTWNTQNTDVDLHALDNTSGRWFTTQDCFYANRHPDAALPEANRRWLDTDDVDGEGPENIRVDVPVTDREYQIGVHFFSSHGQHAQTRATAVIYCGEQRMGTYVRDLTGDRSGSDANDFWNVAGVRFDTPATCTVRTIGRLTTATVVRNGG